MSREKGIELVSLYDCACGDNYIASFCDYIEISVLDFWTKVYDCMSPELFLYERGKKPKPKFKVGFGL